MIQETFIRCKGVRVEIWEKAHSCKSLLFLLSNGLLATNDKLHKCGKAPSALCHSCLQPDSLEHLLSCQATKQLTDPLMEQLLSIQGAPVSSSKLMAVDLNIPAPLRLPSLFILAECVQTLLDLRKSRKRLDMPAVIAYLRAKSTVFLESKLFCFAHTMVQLWVSAYFDSHHATSSSQA